jgi:DNA-binding NarL/FixJ family response regulator
MSGSDQTRLLLVEDVPQVAQYIRGLLNAQSRVKLLDVLDDGTRALGPIQELRPDVVLVDCAPPGPAQGPRLVERSARPSSTSRSSC